MRVYDKFYINGEWVDPVSPKSLDVINPATEQVCANISIGSAADVDRAASAARAAFHSFSRTTREQRIEMLAALLRFIKSVTTTWLLQFQRKWARRQN
jgi:aldehyde dehydrogenase (NAD+)